MNIVQDPRRLMRTGIKRNMMLCFINAMISKVKLEITITKLFNKALIFEGS